MVKIHQQNEKIQKIEDSTGNNFFNCYQCGKCTAGCPLNRFMDKGPSYIIRLLQRYEIDKALRNDTLWWCVGCKTCSSRCPQNIEIDDAIDSIRELAIKEKTFPESDIYKFVMAFHDAFLKTVKKYGRANELQLVNLYKIKTATFLQDLGLGLKMMLQGKIHPTSMVFPNKIKELKEIKEIFKVSFEDKKYEPLPGRKPIKQLIEEYPKIEIDPTKPIGYYPGCSLSGTGKEFDISTRKLAELLNLNLVEIDDWNCCGASSAHSTNHLLSILLPARTHLRAEAQGLKYVLTPCAACLNRAKLAHIELKRSETIRSIMRNITGIEFRDKSNFIGIIELLTAIPAEHIKERIKRPLSGIKLACYYGCLLTRPVSVMRLDDTENPTRMDNIVKITGADTVDWDFKTECCGASLAMASPDAIERLTYMIIKNAHQAGADGIVVSCPLCHMNLDSRQKRIKETENISPLPIYYLPELLAISLGARIDEVGINTHFTEAIKPLSKIL